MHLPDDKMFLSAAVHVDTLPDRAEVSYERAMVEGRPCLLGLCGRLLRNGTLATAELWGFLTLGGPLSAAILQVTRILLGARGGEEL